MREMRVNVFLSAGVLLILIALAVINVTLQKRNSELVQQVDFARTELSVADSPKPGTMMPAELPVMPPTGGPSRMLNIRYSTPKLVLLLFSPDCSVCEENWRYWDELRNDENSSGAFLPVSTSPNITNGYREKHHIASVILLNRSLQESLNMSATPETILIVNGVVRRTWFGLLSDDDVRAVLTALKN